VSADEATAAVTAAGVPPSEVGDVVDAYSASKLQSLRLALAVVLVVGVLGLLVTGGLPKEPLGARGPPAA